MAIDSERGEYLKALPEWDLVNACALEQSLDELIMPLVGIGDSNDAKDRNKQYKERASWFGATAFTMQGLVGTAFEDAPVIELPPMLEYLRRDCDGQGTDLQQQMQECLSAILRNGRAGLLTTFPQVDGDVSRQDVLTGRAVPTTHFISAKRIINWWTVKDGAKVRIGGVVFRATRETIDDYEVKETAIMRELFLDETGAPFDRTWVKDGKTGKWIAKAPLPIVGASGEPLSEIPFVFVGAIDNTVSVDRPPLLALARLNRAHYRNSADYEEAAYYAGQAVPYIEPVDGFPSMEDLEDAKKDGWTLGSRAVIWGKLGFAQAAPNLVSREAMLDKEAQMKAIGARLLEPGTVAKTATESAGQMRAQHSVLSLACSNIEDAYNRALRFADEFLKAGEGSVKMSREYMRRDVADARIQQFVALWDRGLVGASEAYRVLSGAGIVDPDKPADDYAEDVASRGGLIGADG